MDLLGWHLLLKFLTEFLKCLAEFPLEFAWTFRRNLISQKGFVVFLLASGNRISLRGVSDSGFHTSFKTRSAIGLEF